MVVPLYQQYLLTYLGQEKMAPISQTTFSNGFSGNVWISIYISIGISLKFVPKGPINNISSLVQIMAWQQAIIWTNNG